MRDSIARRRVVVYSIILTLKVLVIRDELDYVQPAKVSVVKLEIAHREIFPLPGTLGKVPAFLVSIGMIRHGDVGKNSDIALLNSLSKVTVVSFRRVLIRLRAPYS